MEHHDSPTTIPVAVSEAMIGVVEQAVEGRRVPATVELCWNDEIGQFEMLQVKAWSWSL